MSVGGISAGQISFDAIQGMDIETAMMAVQSNRANTLEGQLKDQMSAVQARNNKISQYNTLMGTLNKAAARFPSDAKSDANVKATIGADGVDQIWNDVVENDLGNNFAPLESSFFVGSKTTKGELDGMIQQLKSMIDSQSNSSQMDMLRLQSLTNKRNEAFEIMSNFMKKIADSKSGILSTWR